MLADILLASARFILGSPKTSVLLLVASLVLYYAVIYPIFLSPLRSVPGPYLHRVSRLFALNDQRTQLWISKVHKLHQKYGKVVIVAPNEISVDGDHKFVQDIYVRNFPKLPFYRNFKNHGSRDNMFSEETNERHLQYRKLLLPLYQKTAIFSPANTTRGVLCEKVSQLVDQVYLLLVSGLEPDFINELLVHNEYGKGHSKKGHWLDISLKTNLGIEMYSLFGLLAMDMVLSFELGKQNGTNLLLHPEDRHIIILHRLQAGMGFWTTLAPKLWDWAATPEILEASKIIEKWQLGLYEKAENNVPVTKNGENLSSLEQLKLKGFHKENAYSFLLDNIFAGHETTAIQLTYLTYELSRPCNFELQERLIKEIRNEFGEPHDRKDMITDLEAVDSMKYLEALFQENLRLHALIPGAEPRVVDKPYKVQLLEKEAVIIPPATTILCQPYSIQRVEEIFPNTESFQPDRWLQYPEESDEEYRLRLVGQQRYMMPFGKGIRMCLGMNLAMIEMKLAMVNMYWHYRSRICPSWCKITPADEAQPIKMGSWNQGKNETDEEKMVMIDTYTTRPLNDECWLQWYDI